MTKACTFDNPVTMARECWLGGKLICSYSATLWALPEWPIAAEHFFFGANVGDWKTGQMFGDPEAMVVVLASDAGSIPDPESN